MNFTRKWLIIFSCSLGCAQSFSPLLLRGARRYTSLFQDNQEANDEPDSSAGLILSDDAKSQLFSSFAALDLSDQYDAVLTGLCAKILDNNALTESDTQIALQDPIQLVQEMNQKRIPASPRSLMALIDATVKSQDARMMAKVLTLCTKNSGGIDQFGSKQAEILPLPPNPTSRIKCPDGSFKTRAERLDSVPDVPIDDRETETAYALAFAGLLGTCGSADLLHVDAVTPFTDTVLFGVTSLGIVDNFYDLLSKGMQFASSQIQKDRQEKIGVNLPSKSSLPFGLGSGTLTGSTVRGVTRLTTVDAERESQCEAAALFTAYALGLPCFAFRPNAYESSVLVAESIRENDIDPLLSSSGIMKILVWLMAPVAMENAYHSQLIVSDPREADGFLSRMEELGLQDPNVAKEIWWAKSEQEKRDLIKWAFAEADLFLRDNRAVVTEISRRLAGGAATVGDCVAANERWQ